MARSRFAEADLPGEDEEPDAGLFSKREREIIKNIESSRLWKLIRDALGYEREMLSRIEIDPDARNLPYVLGHKEGRLAQVNRLLRQGPLLAVYYDRFLREKESEGEERGGPKKVLKRSKHARRVPGERPEV